MNLSVGFKVKRYRDLSIYYDSDIGFTVPIRQRTFKDENGVMRSPITQMLLNRLVADDCKAPVAKDFEPRYINACMPNPANDTGESNLKVIIPYRPTDEVSFKAHVREIRDYPDVAAIDYKGETHTSSIARYFR
jgi:hypothetical protein